MTVLEAAERVLSEAGISLPVRDIAATMLAKGYWQTQGLTCLFTTITPKAGHAREFGISRETLYQLFENPRP